MATSSSTDDPDLLNLQSTFDEQQAKITALREIIRQTEAVNDIKHASAQEKVKNIAQRLTHFKTKVTTSRLNRASSMSTSSQSLAGDTGQKNPTESIRFDTRGTPFQRGRSESSGIDKCSLLRQQIEENRQKMAERESSQREVEEKVIKIKHMLDEAQQSLKMSTELERSNTCLADLDSLVMNSAAYCNQSLFDSETGNITTSTQYNFTHEVDDAFQEDLTQFEGSVRGAQMEQKNNETLEHKIATLEDSLLLKENILEEQLRSFHLLVNSLLQDDSKSAQPSVLLINDLYNMQIQLFQHIYKVSSDEAASRLIDSYGCDPIESAAAKNRIIQETASAAELSVAKMQYHETTRQTDNIEFDDAVEKIAALEQTIASQDAEMERLNQQMTDLRHSLEERTIELNVMTANVSVLQEKLKTSGPKPLFPRTADEEAETETSKLKQQLDESNKNMIKCKLKIKQLQKQVETFKKASNMHEEVARLTEELSDYSQRLIEAEKRKTSQSGIETDCDTLAPELQKRIEMLELTCQNQATAMQLLEEQKNDLSEDLYRIRNELQSLNDHVTVTDSGDNGRIASQMLSIELEEKLEKCIADKTELTQVLSCWEAEKSELQQKLQHYAKENEELRGKIDKLSLEKVSSAESIEILENLTLHEKQEMENSEKRVSSEGKQTDTEKGTERNLDDSKEDLNESLLKLMEESKELMVKVELFTDERREVLEKLDAISIENQAYICELDKLKEANEQLRSYSVELASAKSELEDKLRVINNEKETILQDLDTAKVSKNDGDDASGHTVFQPFEMPEEQAFDKDVYQQSLLAVETEVTNYNKSKDKQKKIQISKKLTVNAKTMVTMSRLLVDEYDRYVSERTALYKQDKDSAISVLEAKLDEVNKSVEVKNSQIAQLQNEIALLKHELEKSSDDEPELLKVELNSKNDEIMLLKKDIDALVDAKSAELLQIQHRLLDAQKEIHHLKGFSTEVQYQLDVMTSQRTKDVEARDRQIEQLQSELRSSRSARESLNEHISQAVEQKQNTIDVLNVQIQDLYEKIQEAFNRAEKLEAEKKETEQKNEELLEKLKKFAANLKKKNIQYTSLEKDNERLKESNRNLTERLEMAENEPPSEDANELKAENEQLSQKLHHLNNELHRLLEQKYQMESECQTSREELRTLGEKLAQTQATLLERCAQLESVEAELVASRAETSTAREEVSSKNSKIEKCKAIIKEKIKETQRLQERDRRTAYLEDELRMTQSKLEDFHNQTLLLGRLKSEKEELNGAVKAEHEQRKCVEDRLAQLQQEFEAVQERIRMLDDNLSYVEGWVKRYGAKWHSPTESQICVKAEDVSPDMFRWFDILLETDKFLTQMFAQKAKQIKTIQLRLLGAEQDADDLEDEVSDIETELENTRYKCKEYAQRYNEKEQAAAQLRQELSTAQSELQRAMGELSQMTSQASEQVMLRDEIEMVQAQLLASQHAELAMLRQQLENASHDHTLMIEQLQNVQETNAAYSAEVTLLRENVLALERRAVEESANIAKLNTLNETLRSEIQQMQEKLAATEDGQKEALVRCDHLQATNETMQDQLVQEKHVKEQLNETLKQRDQELHTMRRKYEELTEQQNVAGRYQTIELERLNQLLHEAEKARVALQHVLDSLQSKNGEQSREIELLRESLTSLERQSQEDKTNVTILTSLNQSLNEDLDLLQQQTSIVDQRYQSLLDEFDQMRVELEGSEAARLQEVSMKEQLQHSLQSKEQECVELQQTLAELRDECGQLKQTLEKSDSAIEQPQQQPKPEQDFCMWDDAEGWGDTARLEEIISTRDDQIKQLGFEKELMAQEITDLKVKSGKLLRKLKECKVKCDALEATGQGGNGAGTAAPVVSSDALENRIQELEWKLGEVEHERTMLQREKATLDMKLDMLENACEKLTEVKEYQDQQIEMLKKAQDAVQQQGPGVPSSTAAEEELKEKVRQCTATLQVRESEIAHLNARLEKLVEEATVMVNLRQRVDELEQLNEVLKASNTPPSTSEVTDFAELQREELQHTNQLLEQEKAEMTRELEVLNQQILHDLQFEDRLNKALLELDAKGVEIQMLRSTLEQLQCGGAGDAPPIIDEQGQNEQITNLKERVQELEQERAHLLQEHVREGEPQLTPPQVIDDATVKEVLERQELEIVTLKEQLALRSAEYARLAARVDPSKLFQVGLGTWDSMPKPEQQQLQQSGDRELRAKLESTLYESFQIEMRCKELELELRNLLKERDTLQLKLSNALRLNEEYKLRCAGSATGDQAEYGTSGECSIDASPDRSLVGLPTDMRPLSSLSGSRSVNDSQDLTSKLSELHSISYANETRWQEEREDRNRQLALNQRDLANMPLGKVLKFSETLLSADSEATSQQNASTGLLSWLLGKK
ncbi:protein lava lamp-like [Anopheles nili]|uniref:protein lava lamp-like n=1 Tax=Anopheles nili TaxID=185578 RepID=UPI00237B065A|nr:protein lava lamp-like [Anopheles nili]